jgi:hypothetical protein
LDQWERSFEAFAILDLEPAVEAMLTMAPPVFIASMASWVESITPRRLRSSMRIQWSALAPG